MREGAAKPPLVVDLDGTLIVSDVFVSALWRCLAREPLGVAVWALRGAAHLKAQVARAQPCDPTALPYDQRLLAWLTAERAEARVTALATASDVSAARRVAEHLDVFDHVFASDGSIHLKGANKARALQAAFPNGFAYAGNAWADVPVWQAAASAIVVNAPEPLVRYAQRAFAIERIFERL